MTTRRGLSSPRCERRRAWGSRRRLPTVTTSPISSSIRSSAATSAAVSGAGVVRIGDEFQIVLTATRLPSTVHPGAVVDALIRSRAKGYASLHVLPVDAKVARTVLDRRAAMQRYTAREGNDAIDNQVALADTTAALAAIAQRQLIPCRIALSFAVRDSVLAKAAETAERLDGLLRGQGFEIVHPTSPGLLPSLAVTPGGAPARTQSATDVRRGRRMSDSRSGHAVCGSTAATRRDQPTHRSAGIPLHLESTKPQRRARWQLGIGQECGCENAPGSPRDGGRLGGRHRSRLRNTGA